MTAETSSVGRRSLPVAVRVGVFLCCGVVAAVLGALFQRVSASRVDIDDLGAFNAILAVVGGTGLLGLGLQLVVVRQRLSTDSVVRVGGVVTVMVVAAGAAAVPGPAWYRLAVAGLIGAVVATTFGGLVPRARLLWRRSWVGLGAVYVVGAVTRLAVVVPLLAVIDTRILAAVAATVLAEAAMAVTAVALNAVATRRSTGAADEVGDPLAGGAPLTAASLRRLAPTVAVLAGLWVLTIGDTLLARLRLAAAAADSYALASTVARASFFLALLLAHLALPTFMRERGRSTWLKRAFDIATLAIGAVAIAVAAVIVLWPSGVARLVLGDEAAVVDVGVLRLLAIGWAAMSLVPLLTFFTVDRHPRLGAVPLAVALAAGAAGLVVESAAGIAWLMVGGAAVCLVAMGVPALQRLSPITRAVPWDGAAHLVASHAGAAAEVGVAMVVPFYNPGAAVLIDTVGRLATTLAATGRGYRIVAVSDGSTDGSAEALQTAALPHVTVVTMPDNRGKGAALRVGFGAVTAPLVGFIDADGDLPPEQIAQFLEIAEASDADAVVGSKLHPASVLSVQQHRRIMSSVFRRLVRLCFRLDVRDTQTGVKLYRGATLSPLVSKLAEDGFAIDVEILVAARRGGPLRIVEAPVTLVRADSSASTISTRGAIATARGLARIFWRDRVAMRYDRHEPTTEPHVSASGAAAHASGAAAHGSGAADGSAADASLTVRS